MTGLNNPPFFTYQTIKPHQDDSKLHIYVPLPDTIIRTLSYHLPTDKVYFVQVNELWRIDKSPVVRLYDKVHNRFDPLLVNPSGHVCTYELSSSKCKLTEISKLKQQNNDDLYILCCLDDQVGELIPATDIEIEPLQELLEVFTLVTENGLWIVNGQLIVDSSTFVGGDVDVDVQVTAEEDIIEKEVVKHITDLEDLTIDELLQTT